MVLHQAASRIQEGICSGEIAVTVVGLGQIGFPLALRFALKGATVNGADTDRDKVHAIQRGDCPDGLKPHDGTLRKINGRLRATCDVSQAVREGSVHIICVPTPLADGAKPDLSAVTSAAKAVGLGLRKDGLVVLESSVYPGVTSGIVKPILEECSGMKAGEDFGLAYCFERIDPGNTVHRIDNTPRVVGGINEASTSAASAVYQTIIETDVVPVRDCATAELVKLTENVYRDVNIAFVNELSLLCHGLGIDVLEVVDAASTKWSFAPHLPGAGVGGTCIPVNPYYLMKAAEDAGVELPLVQQARKTNESMPGLMVQAVKDALSGVGKPVEGSRVCVLGLAYKGNMDDTRGAPAEGIMESLRGAGADVVCYDPVVTCAPQTANMQNSLEEAVTGSDCVVITNDHSCFASLDLQEIASLAHNPLTIVDGRHVIEPREARALGINYVGLGRAKDSDLTVWKFRDRTNGRGNRD